MDLSGHPSATTNAKAITGCLVDAGVDTVVTLPDSWMSALLTAVHDHPDLRQIPVSSEAEGVGICAGSYLGGRGACLVMANAGFMLCGYALPTLALMHRIPLFMLISYRGKIGDRAFFQEYQGILTERILQAMQIEYSVVSEPEQIPQLADAYNYSQVYRRPAAALLCKDVLLGESG